MRIEKANEVFYRVGGDPKEISYLRQDMTFMVPGAQFSRAFKEKRWNGKCCYLDFRTMCFPRGLYKIAYDCCRNWGFPLSVDEGVQEDLKPTPVANWAQFEASLNLPFPPRDYQTAQATTALAARKGIIVSPTGSGKSMTIYLIVRWLLENTKGAILIVVPSKTLVSQMYEDFKSYGMSLIDAYAEKLYQGQEPTFRKRILITTYQSIMKREPEFFQRYETLINDEAHSVKSAMLMKIAKCCSNARYRLGFTGTIPKEEVDKNNIFGVLGQQIYELKSKELMDEGVLSGIAIVNLFLRYSEVFRTKGSNRTYPEEVKLVEEAEERNAAFDFILGKIPSGQNTLVLFGHIEHLERTEEYLRGKYPDKRIEVIQGKTDVDERMDIKSAMEDEKDFVLLATYGTMSTGVNIKRIHNIVFAASSKSHIRVLQSIGRGLRLHESKARLVLWDMIDDLSYLARNGRVHLNYLMKHWNQRYQIYTEQNFQCYKKTLDLTRAISEQG